ncbi:MAG TPA: FimV/HubP family polar landmark protein [Burkholderiales bacterium]|nr:FimV/HubP family polar landmark protein [Burkholderiales bacterium]
MGKSIAGRMLAAALLLAPLLAHAVGLGKLTVLSALGQPLNAEIAVVSEQGEELDSLNAHVASQDAFAKAGIEYNPVLLGMKLDVERADGKAVLRLRTTQPVNEPFLDILVELQWSSGKLMREYTFLLDPAEYKGPQPIAAAPPPAPPVSLPTQGPTQQAAPAPQPVEEKPIAPAPEPAATAQPPTPAKEEVTEPIKEPAKAPAQEEVKEPLKEPAKEQTYEVKKGDTLGEIAHRYMLKGVTYNQMLIALFRANREAFIRDNVNLVKAGGILKIPGQDEASAVDPEEAREQVRANMAEFAEYRRKLAAAAAAAQLAKGESTGQQTAAGHITEKPAEPTPQATQDQLKLSKAEPGKAGSAANLAARGDDAVARERALAEAQSRVHELEKNVSDLQKLLEVRNEQLAELRKQAAAQQGPAPTPAPAQQQSPQPPPPQQAPQAAPQPSQQGAQPAPSLPQPPTRPAPPPEAQKPKPQSKKVAPPPPPPEPSLVDEVLENPVALGGIGAVVALLLGYGAWAWQRKKSTRTSFQESVAAGGSGGPEGGAAPGGPEQQPGGIPSQVSVSQAGVGELGADEVDPIAEADVYMAYGRDAQAEEILKEALQKDPNRVAVHAKLLEIYSGRRDTNAFEQTALKLKGLTSGTGADWEKAAALGRSIDPQNGLYGGGAAETAQTDTSLRPTPAAAPTLDFDLDSAQSNEAAKADVDFDLDTGTHEALPAEQSAFSAGGTLKMKMDKEEERTASGGLDFDLGGGDKTMPPDVGLDFELPAVTQAVEQPAAKGQAADKAGSIDFDLNLDSEAPKQASVSGAAQAPIDLSSISLDLGGAGESVAPATQTDPKWQEVATKLDLAKAYEDMGDKDGARELLNEVLKEGDAAQKGQAQQMLSSLG